jgi:hypothetical protein
MEFNIPLKKSCSFLLASIILIICHIFNKVIKFTPVFFNKAIEFVSVYLSDRVIKFVNIAIEFVNIVVVSGVIAAIDETSN